MVEPGGSNESYLRAFCNVAATPESSLEDFLASAVKLGQEREISRVHVFAAESLSVVLFERRIRATGDELEDDKAAERLKKLQERLFAKYVVTDDRVSRPGVPNKVVKTRKKNPVQELLRQANDIYPAHDGLQVVTANSVVPSSKAGSKTPVGSTELALLIDADSTIAELLQRRSEILEESANNVVKRHRLPRADYDPRRALEIPFMHASFSGESECHDFVSKLAADTPVTGLGIEPMKHRLELAQPED